MVLELSAVGTTGRRPVLLKTGFADKTTNNRGREMVDLAWHHSYEIGISLIDEDHKSLLNIMQGIRDAVQRADMPASTELLRRLAIEARNHFDREELFLQQVGYPELESHKTYHEDLLAQVSVIERICEGTDHHRDLNSCVDRMAAFLVDDILKGDIQFKSFLEYEGHIPVRK